MIRECSTTLTIAWFLWSIIYPLNTSISSGDIRPNVVKEFASQKACEKAVPKYLREIEKAFPIEFDKNGYGYGYHVDLKCSPVFPWRY